LLEGLRERMRENYKVARQRETRFVMSFNIPRLNNRLVILLLVFITLNGLDVLTTLLALSAGPAFVELNPIASQLFSLSLPGFIGALALKYMPIVPLAYVTFMKERVGRPVAYRVVKIAGLVALSAGVVFYILVVGSNLVTLLGYYL